MAVEITGKLELVVSTNDVYLHTNNEHDTLAVSNLSLTGDEAASLAWLMNEEDNVHIEIKKVGE